MVDVTREGTPTVAIAAPGINAVAVAAPGQPVRRHRSLWGDAWRRLVRNKLAMFGLIGIAFLLFLAVTADWIMPFEYDYQNFGNIAEPPSWEFPLGTDLVGRDMLSRM